MITLKTSTFLLLMSCLAHNSYAEQNSLSPSLFNKLKNVPTLDLANPRLESTEYKALGLPIIQPTPQQKAAIRANIKKTPDTINKKIPNIENCQWIGVNIELDDQNSTQEYLFTPTNACSKPTSSQSKPFWIVQQMGNKAPQVLIADHAYQVRIWKKEAAAKRRIETITKGNAPSRYTQKPIDVRCHSNWSFMGGGYQYRPDYIEVYRSDASSRGKTWVIVEGQDPYVAIDQNFRCSR